MRRLILASILLTQFLFVGCAGVGIVSTSDPRAKMNDAIDLYRKQNRPLPAEKDKRGQTRLIDCIQRAFTIFVFYRKESYDNYANSQ